MAVQQNSLVTRVAETATRAWRFNRLLTLSIVINLSLIPVALFAMLIDPVAITGVNGWIKPLKFLISAAIYAATLLWMLTLVRRGRRWVGLVGGLAGMILLAEIALIIMQVLRGTSSHFNVATPLDSAVFSAMGGMITTLAVLNLVTAIWLMLQPLDDRVLTLGVRWGVWVTLAGMVVAYLMTTPTAAQLEAARSGAAMTVAGAHSVGVADGGPGLPFVGWSTVGGDLRIPHFVGLHAMQVLPLLAWWLRRPRAARRWSESQRAALVHVGGATYLGFLVLLTWQALRGQSIVAPDGWTLVAALALFGTATLALLWIVRPRTASVSVASGPVR